METIKKLSEKLPVEAIQSTKGADTKKGYDTDGYSYQYCVDRFNDTCGENWGFTWKVLREVEGEFKSGAPAHDITVDVSIWVNDILKPRSAPGGHISISYADALKGAVTNGFKKAAAFWGVGRDAYAGTIDDDNKPMPDTLDNMQTKSENKTLKDKKEWKDFTPAEKNIYWKNKAEKLKYDWSMIEGLDINVQNKIFSAANKDGWKKAVTEYDGQVAF